MAYLPNIPQDFQPQPVPQEVPTDQNQTAMPVGGVQAQSEEPLVIGDSSPQASAETLDKRATKFKYGLGDLLQKSKDEIYQNLQDGRENELRSSAAATLDQRKQASVKQLVIDYSNNKMAAGQPPATEDESRGLAQAIQDMSADTDPDTVLETAYGKQFMATIDRVAENQPSNIWTDVTQVHPEFTAQLSNRYGELISKQQVIDTQIENVEDILKDQGYVGYGYDIVRSMIPGYTDYRMRGLNPEVGQFTGIGRGENLEEQRKALLRLPTDDMAAQLKTIIAPLMEKDPHIALEYLKAMKGQSSDEAFINDWTLPTEFIGTGIGAAAGKAGIKGIKAATRAFKSAEDLGALRDVKTAAADMAKAAARPDASKSTIEAAAGDLKESAVTRTTANAVADSQNIPQATKRGIEALTETHRADMADVRANPGRYGQDMANRIEERGDQMMSNLIDTATNIQKNERLPDVLSTESSVRVIVEDMKNKYRDLKNSIIDTSKIYREALSNTYHMDFLIGNKDGTYFAKRETAEKFVDFHGLADAEIVKGKEAKFTPEVVEQNKITSNIESAQRIIDNNTRKLSAEPADEVASKAQEQIDLAKAYIKEQQANRKPYTVNIDQQGLGYYVRVTKPIDETRPAIREAIAQTKNTKIPDSPVATFLNSWIGKYRTPEEVLSKAERANRLTTTYAPSSYFNVMVENAKEIKGLQAGRFGKGYERWKQWQRGLENAQELPDALDPDRKGYFFKDPTEMETYWQKWFQRLPDEQEVAAYFEFKRGMEMDRIFRNIAEQRNKSRIGTERHTIILKDASGAEVRSPDFDGVLKQKVPGAEGRIAIFTNKVGEESMPELSRMSTAKKAEIQKDMDAGKYKLIELWDPKQRALSGFSSISDERLRYALVPQLETRSLDWNHVPRRGGGHIQYDYDYYLKQAKITTDSTSNIHWYEGDTTIMAAPGQGVGSRVADHLNEVRKLLASRDIEAARAYSEKNLHVDWKEVQSWFMGYKDEYGKFQPPRLSINQDIHVVPKNRKIIDHDNNLRFKYSDFRDGTREGSLAAQHRVGYTEERDAWELLGVNVEGTKANPLYKVAPADKIDPITTMNRGFAQIARSNFMDDYKTMAVEHWLQQAKGWLDVKTQDQIFHSPYYYYNEGKFLPNTPPEIKTRLEAARYHTQQLTGQPSDTDALLYSAAQKLADVSFNAFGPKGLVLTPTWLLPKLKDPFGFARSIAFDLKLGLFNIPQFVVQAGNYANILGIAGYKYAAPGTLAAQLHFWTRVNSDSKIIAHLDDLATKMSLPGTSKWKAGEFTEALQEFHRTGFGNVGGEYAALDDFMSNKVISNAGSTFLDWGRMPFKAGEQNARYGAWYTAFKEFRDANPIGRITNEDRASILQRADLLNVNMSRASSSALHKGILSIPTQFYTYQLRLMELMFGSRLSSTERARLFLTNAALFGIPMATGLTGLPVADWLRQKALEGNSVTGQPYVVGDDYIKSMLMEGIPSAIGAMITGRGDPQAGTWYDIGPRFGTKGFEFLGSATGSPDKGWLDTLGGPVYSIAKDTIAASDGLTYAVASMMRGDGDVFPMVMEDVADVAKEISSFNSAWRIYAASQFGRWVSKKDAYLTEGTTGQAIFTSMFGTKDVAINDIQIMSNSLKSQKAYEDKVEEQFRQEFRRGVNVQTTNPELAKRFFTRAQAWLAISGYREDRISNVMSKALNDNQSVMDKVDWDFYIRKTPDQNSQGRYGAMQKTLRIQDKKRGE